MSTIRITTESHKVRPVILCGGSGSRLWPLSRKSLPKQFAPLLPKKSLLKELCYVSSLILINSQFLSPMKVTGFMLCMDSVALGLRADIFLESEGKNTAPAALLSALHTSLIDPSEILIISPSDHLIENEKNLIRLSKKAFRSYRKGAFRFLNKAQVSEAGFGYIQVEKEIFEGVFEVTNFKEKPSLKIAKQMLKREDWLWNSGIFMISAKTLLSLGRRFQLEMMAKVADAYDSLDTDGQFLRPKPNAWNSIPVGSIDNALVSKAANSKHAIRCSRITGTWSDLGSWPALMESLEEDKDQNLSTENVSLFDCNHTNAWALQDGPVIVRLGLRHKTIVSTSDVIFVADNKRMDGLKELVQELEKSGVAEATSHKKHFRPWGWFESTRTTWQLPRKEIACIS